MQTPLGKKRKLLRLLLSFGRLEYFGYRIAKLTQEITHNAPSSIETSEEESDEETNRFDEDGYKVHDKANREGEESRNFDYETLGQSIVNGGDQSFAR